MATLPYTSSADKYPTASFEPLPAGTYEAIVVQSSFGDNSKGTGQVVKLMWQIIEPGKGLNRTVFSQHNVIHDNPDAEQIGRRELQDFATAMGVPEFQETDDLHGKPVVIRLHIEPAKGQYTAKNGVSGVVAPNSKGAPAAQVQRPQPTQAPRNTAAPATQSSRPSNATPRETPPAHVAAQANGRGSGSGTAKPATAGNTRGNPFAE